MTDAPKKMKAIPMSRLISSKYVYRTLNDVSTYRIDNYHIYGGFNIKKQNFEWVGKPESDTSYCVTFLKEPDVVIERLTEEFLKYRKDDEVLPATFDMTTIGVAKMYANLQNPDITFSIDNRKEALLLDENIILVKVQNPMKMAWAAINHFQQMILFLNQYVNKVVHEDTLMLDITDLIYDTVPGKNGKPDTYRVKQSIMKGSEVIVKDVPVFDASPIAIKLQLGLDTIPKPTLNSLGATMKSVKVFTRRIKSDEKVLCVRVGTMVETTEGYSMTWAFPSNLRTHKLKVKK